MSEDPRRAHARAHARTRQRRPSGPSPMPPMPERVGMRQMPTNVSTAAWDAERARFFADYGARIYSPNLSEDTNLNIVDIAEKWHTSYSKITDILVRGASARDITFDTTLSKQVFFYCLDFCKKQPGFPKTDAEITAFEFVLPTCGPSPDTAAAAVAAAGRAAGRHVRERSPSDSITVLSSHSSDDAYDWYVYDCLLKNYCLIVIFAKRLDVISAQCTFSICFRNAITQIVSI